MSKIVCVGCGSEIAPTGNLRRDARVKRCPACLKARSRELYKGYKAKYRSKPEGLAVERAWRERNYADLLKRAKDWGKSQAGVRCRVAYRTRNGMRERLNAYQVALNHKDWQGYLRKTAQNRATAKYGAELVEMWMVAYDATKKMKAEAVSERQLS